MGRPPKVPAPQYTLEDAIAAALTIRALRAEAHDPDLDFFPTTVRDDTDIDDVVDYIGAHRARPADVRAAELPARAVLIAYQHQRDTARNKRRMLALLEAARDVHAPSMTYGPKIGLPSRAAVHNRWHRLTVELRRNGQAPPTRREKERETRLDRWLVARGGDLLAVGEMLVDNRDYLLGLLPDPEQRQQLAEAIDQAGEDLGRRPRQAFAGAISYAMFLLRDNGPAIRPADPIVREGIELGARLRTAFNELRSADGGPAA
jgi:hypothetical protein